MATHSSVLAWRIPGTEEPGRLPSMGSHRVGHDRSDLAAAAAARARTQRGPRGTRLKGAFLCRPARAESALSLSWEEDFHKPPYTLSPRCLSCLTLAPVLPLALVF